MGSRSAMEQPSTVQEQQMASYTWPRALRKFPCEYLVDGETLCDLSAARLGRAPLSPSGIYFLFGRLFLIRPPVSHSLT